MQFTKEEIQKFKNVYKKHYGADISDEVALDGYIRLVNFVKAVSKPIPKVDYEGFLKKEDLSI